MGLDGVLHLIHDLSLLRVVETLHRADKVPGDAKHPTCVGKTAGTSEHSSVTWKHPHVRGEDLMKLRGRSSCTETPPRAWGRRITPDAMRMFDGNTPTCVGKTDSVITLKSRT